MNKWGLLTKRSQIEDLWTMMGNKIWDHSVFGGSTLGSRGVEKKDEMIFFFFFFFLFRVLPLYLLKKQK